jgi:hypothetical protein
MNDRHFEDVDAVYFGECPPDMMPGAVDNAEPMARIRGDFSALRERLRGQGRL